MDHLTKRFELFLDRLHIRYVFLRCDVPFLISVRSCAPSIRHENEHNGLLSAVLRSATVDNRRSQQREMGEYGIHGWYISRRKRNGGT